MTKKQSIKTKRLCVTLSSGEVFAIDVHSARLDKDGNIRAVKNGETVAVFNASRYDFYTLRDPLAEIKPMR